MFESKLVFMFIIIKIWLSNGPAIKKYLKFIAISPSPWFYQSK